MAPSSQCTTQVPATLRSSTGTRWLPNVPTSCWTFSCVRRTRPYCTFPGSSPPTCTGISTAPRWSTTPSGRAARQLWPRAKTPKSSRSCASNFSSRTVSRRSNTSCGSPWRRPPSNAETRSVCNRMTKYGEHTMQMALSSKLIFTLIGVSLPVAAHAADMSQTHIYNPHWPQHAKFHNGQTLSMSLLLGGLAIFLAWWPSNNVHAIVPPPPAPPTPSFTAQTTPILSPNTAYFDPEFQPQTLRGVPLAVVIDVIYLSAVLVAAWLGFRGAW